MTDSQDRESASGPFVPASSSLPEITASTLILGGVLAVLMAGANAYLGLFASTTISASIPAAIVSMAVLRLVGGNILQNNAVQTAATSGEALAGGAIFTIPALVLLGTWTRFHYWESTVLALFGGVLGVLFTIPMRRAMIVEQPLRFPEGVATAEVLKAGHRGGGGAGALAMAAVVGGALKLCSTGLHLWRETAAITIRIGDALFYGGISMSPALIAVGFIVGLNIGVLVFLGGVANWMIAIPLYSALGAPVPGADSMRGVELAAAIWSGQTRYIGVGAMLVGGLWALISLAPSLVRGIRASLEAHAAARSDPQRRLPRTERDLPAQLVLGLSIVSLLPLTVIFYRFSHSVGLAAFMAVFVVVAGFLFCAVASYMAGLVGSSNNPISGVTIATILSAALLLKLLGLDARIGPPIAIFIGAAVCCAAAIGGDTMQDLKAGHILGSTPYKQQIMQAVGVVASCFVMAPVLNLLNDAYVIGSPKLVAAQAGLMTAVARGIFEGDLPWTMVAVGGGVAVAVIAFDLWLASRKSTFRTPVLALAVGIYLPFELSTPIFLGALVAKAASRKVSQARARSESGGGLLFSAGVITGEALMGIGLAVPIVVAGNPGVLALTSDPLTFPGLLLLGAVVWLLYRAATRDVTGT
ncbi:MAG TPA: oligopeptide transporter, OPT family [Kofleriaceae bacterium]|nr:oligopeptide transporter, OPT family [Kofleriaceae bacterium]